MFNLFILTRMTPIFTNYAARKTITQSTFCATNDTNLRRSQNHPDGISEISSRPRLREIDFNPNGSYNWLRRALSSRNSCFK